MNRGILVLFVLAFALFAGITAFRKIGAEPPPSQSSRPPAATSMSSNRCTRPPFATPPGKWTRIDKKKGCRLIVQRDPAFGIRNCRLLAKLRPNGRADQEVFVGVKDGRYLTAYNFSSAVKFFLVMPAGNNPIHFIHSKVRTQC